MTRIALTFICAPLLTLTACFAGKSRAICHFSNRPNTS